MMAPPLDKTYVEQLMQQEMARIFSSEFHGVCEKELTPFMTVMRLIRNQYASSKPEVYRTLIAVLHNYNPASGSTARGLTSKLISSLLETEAPELARYLVSILPPALDSVSNKSTAKSHALHVRRNDREPTGESTKIKTQEMEPDFSENQKQEMNNNAPCPNQTYNLTKPVTNIGYQAVPLHTTCSVPSSYVASQSLSMQICPEVLNTKQIVPSETDLSSSFSITYAKQPKQPPRVWSNNDVVLPTEQEPKTAFQHEQTATVHSSQNTVPALNSLTLPITILCTAKQDQSTAVSSTAINSITETVSANIPKVSSCNLIIPKTSLNAVKSVKKHKPSSTTSKTYLQDKHSSAGSYSAKMVECSRTERISPCKPTAIWSNIAPKPKKRKEDVSSTFKDAPTTFQSYNEAPATKRAPLDSRACSSFPYKKQFVVLHKDASVAPGKDAVQNLLPKEDKLNCEVLTDDTPLQCLEKMVTLAQGIQLEPLYDQDVERDEAPQSIAGINPISTVTDAEAQRAEALSVITNAEKGKIEVNNQVGSQGSLTSGEEMLLYLNQCGGTSDHNMDVGSDQSRSSGTEWLDRAGTPFEIDVVNMDTSEDKDDQLLEDVPVCQESDTSPQSTQSDSNMSSSPNSPCMIWAPSKHLIPWKIARAKNRLKLKARRKR